MRKGFTYQVMPGLTKKHPGLKGKEYAQMALADGLTESDAKDPVQSLAASLAKEVREGRQKQIRAEKVGGVIRYYPAPDGEQKAGASKKATAAQLEEPVSLRLNRQTVGIVDMFVEVGHYRTRSEVLSWLVEEGIHNNQSMVERVEKAVEQIRTIKRSLKT